MTPGIQPKQHSRTLMSKSHPHPVFRKTDRNGRKMATRYRNTSACEVSAGFGSVIRDLRRVEWTFGMENLRCWMLVPFYI